jgi:transcriptional regulator with XRE-family HTH domain
MQLHAMLRRMVDRPDRFAARLLAARKRAGLSQAKLAKLTGVTMITCWRWEAGKSRPGADVAVRLADALHTSVEKLLG